VDLDAGLGRVHGSHKLASAGLAHRLVRLEPLDAILGAGHVLAGRDQLRPAGLVGSTLMFPAAADRLDFLTRFADEFEISRRVYGTNAGLAAFVAWVRASPAGFSLLPADLEARVETVQLADPVPLYAWSLIWRQDGQHPQLPRLLEAFAAAGLASRWLEFRPGLDWLPATDRA